MTRRIALLLAMLLCLLHGVGARSQPVVGETAPPVLAIAGKQVPLPQGNWIVAGRAPAAPASADGIGSYGTIWNLVLFRLSPATGALDAMAEVNVNDMAVMDGWGIAADCRRGDLMLTVVRGRSGWDAACYFIAHTAWSWGGDMPPAWRQARALAAARGLHLPADTVSSGFRVANRRDVIDLRLHFTAAFAGIDEPPPGDRHASSWTREQLPRDRGRLMFAQGLAEWSAMMIGCVEAGLKQRLPAAVAVPAPGASEAVLENGSVMQQRQQRLAYLRSAGLLSDAQFTRQSALLRQAEAADSHDAVDPAAADFYRLLSFQGLSVTSDAIVTFLWTAQSLQAAALTALQAGLRTGRTYLFGYLWDGYAGTPTRPDAARTLDFAYGGDDR